MAKFECSSCNAIYDENIVKVPDYCTSERCKNQYKTLNFVLELRAPADTEEVKLLKTEINELSKSLMSQKQEYENLVALGENEKRQAESAKSLVIGLEAEVKTKEDEIEQLNQILLNFEEKNILLEQQNEEFSKQNTTILAESELVIKKLHDSETTAKDVAEANQKLLLELKHLKLTCASRDEQIDKQSQTIAKYRKEIDKLQLAIKESQNAMAALEKVATERENDISQQKTFIHELEAKISFLNSSATFIENSDLKNQVSTMQNEKFDLIEQNKRQEVDFQGKLQLSEKELETANLNLRSVYLQLNEKTEAIEDKESKLANLESLLTKSTEELERKALTFNEFEQKQLKLEERNSELVVKFEDKENVFNALKQDFEKSKLELEISRSNNNELNIEVEQKEKDLTKLASVKKMLIALSISLVVAVSAIVWFSYNQYNEKKMTKEVFEKALKADLNTTFLNSLKVLADENTPKSAKKMLNDELIAILGNDAKVNYEINHSGEMINSRLVDYLLRIQYVGGAEFQLKSTNNNQGIYTFLINEGK